MAKEKAPKGKAQIEKKAQALGELKIEYVSVMGVKPNVYNPNRQSDHDFELLIKSMTDDGITQPIIVQSVTKEIVDGEHRWTGAIVTEYLRRKKIDIEKHPEEIAKARDRRLQLREELADYKIPVVFVDMTPEQMRIATLRHNRARGSEDIELTAQVLRDLRELGALDMAQDALMMDDVEMQRLLEDIPAPEALAAEEFSQAWEPSKVSEASDMAKSSWMGAGHVVDSTSTAVEAQRAREKAIGVAKNDEEKAKAVKDYDVFRLSLMYSGEESKIVKSALGDAPAVKLLELCRKSLTPA